MNKEKLHKIEFGPYLLVINEINSEAGVIPLINILDKPYNHSNGNGDTVTTYHQVWHGDMVEFYELMEKATRPAWMK